MSAWMAAILAGTLDCEAIVDVVVHAPDGPHPGWDVVWQGGRITAVGPDVAPAGCHEQRFPGGEVTAGFVATMTSLGLIEVELEGGTRDTSGAGDPIRASLVVSEGYNPLSVVVPVTRLGGITSAIIQPDGGFISGQGGAVRLLSGSWSDAMVTPSVAVFSGLGAPSTGEGISLLRTLLEDARAWRKAELRGNPYVDPEVMSAGRLDLEAMARVAERSLPLVISADRASDIEAVLRLQAAESIRVIIAGGAEGWMLAAQLAAAKIPVIVDPFVVGAGSFDQVHGREDNAALLAAAGVPVIIGAWDTPNARSLRFRAGNAVRSGLGHADALRAITENPARAFGMADRGRLEKGAVADLAVWSGDPLDSVGRLKLLIIDGQAQPLTSRQTELVDRWRDVAPVWAE